jgi:hypothetical protein
MLIQTKSEKHKPKTGPKTPIKIPPHQKSDRFTCSALQPIAFGSIEKAKARCKKHLQKLRANQKLTINLSQRLFRFRGYKIV